MLLTLAAGAGCSSAQEAETLPKVYWFSEISSENLVKSYEALGREAAGRVAVKISTGEPGGHHFLQPALIAGLVSKVDGTIVECNTAYGGGRAATADHLKAAEAHGFTAIAPVDIMDADGDVALPVAGGRHLKEDFVGSHYPDYDFTIVLSHFKGHAMGGFGGAIKNMSIGIASAEGKAWIHTAGKTKSDLWNNLPAQDDFLESMASAAQGVADYFNRENGIIYISVMNNMTVDCDCVAHPAPVKLEDYGILASTDPVALDQACVDIINQQKVTAHNDPTDLIQRIDKQHGTHTIDRAEQIGLGSKQYKIVNIDGK